LGLLVNQFVSRLAPLLSGGVSQLAGRTCLDIKNSLSERHFKDKSAKETA